MKSPTEVRLTLGLGNRSRRLKSCDPNTEFWVLSEDIGNPCARLPKAHIPSATIRAWKIDFRNPNPSLPYPITLFNADSASAECSATTIGPQPAESRFFWTIRAGTSRARLLASDRAGVASAASALRRRARWRGSWEISR